MGNTYMPKLIKYIYKQEHYIISNIMYLHSTYAVDWYHMYLHHQRDRACQNVTKTGGVY